MGTFQGVPPGSGSGEMSRRTQALRPSIALTKQQVADVRRLRRGGLSTADIVAETKLDAVEIEKALLQMRTPRPETTRGTLNITLAARRIVETERRGNEPMWQTFDRLLDELLRLRSGEATPSPARRRAKAAVPDDLPLLSGLR